MIKSASAQQPITPAIDITATLIQQARDKNWAAVIMDAQNGGNVNATFQNEQGVHVTPLLHLVQNIDDFFVKAPVQIQLPVVYKVKGHIKGTHIAHLNTEKTALSYNPVEIAATLIYLGAEIDKKASDGLTTPLLAASQQIPLQPTNFAGKNGAGLAKKKLNLELIELFVKNGADVNVQDCINFKKGVFFEAEKLANKNPEFPQEKPRAMLYNAIDRGLKKRAGI